MNVNIRLAKGTDYDAVMKITTLLLGFLKLLLDTLKVRRM